MIDKILLSTAIILAGANLYLRANLMPAAPKTAPNILISAAAPTNPLSVSPQQPPALPPEIACPKWDPLESEEYPAYIANLRKFGFPEELIRNLIIAEIEAAYAPRINPLKPKPVPILVLIRTRDCLHNGVDRPFEPRGLIQHLVIDKLGE